MDPKQAPPLDPKVKEAYDRVMSTTPTTSTPAPSDPVKPPSPVSPPVQPTAPTPTSPPVVPPQPTIIAGTPQPNTLRREPEKIHIGSAPHAGAGVMQKKSSNGPSPIIYIICGIVFLIAYTIFWLKFFNVPVPFLPF